MNAAISMALMPDEIAEYIRKLGVQRSLDDPESGWDWIRFEADSLFLRKYDREYLTEMRGIADGAAARVVKSGGARLICATSSR